MRMRRTRLDLHEILCEVLGSRNCYFMTAPSQGMIYPAMQYELDGKDTDYADNTPYRRAKRWKITIIDEDPDSPIPNRLEQLQYCSSDRPPYVVDGLCHFVYILYY